jgi:hypothetical protein
MLDRLAFDCADIHCQFKGIATARADAMPGIDEDFSPFQARNLRLSPRRRTP